MDDPPPYVDHLLAEEFSIACIPRVFCSVCAGLICLDCCPNHTAVHHQGTNAVLVEVVMVEGFPALTHRDVKARGMGYDWKHIQRVKLDGNTWVMLRRDRPRRAHSGMTNRCRCGCLIAPKNTFCSPSCKVMVVQRGRSWQLVQHLVNVNFNQLHWRDRYCTTCMRSFSSQHCLSHLSHHPVEEEASLIEIVMEDGFAYIPDPDQQLPAAICARVTRVVVGDGRPAISLRPRFLPDAHDCTYIGCEGRVPIVGNWCSLVCKRNEAPVAGAEVL